MNKRQIILTVISAFILIFFSVFQFTILNQFSYSIGYLIGYFYVLTYEVLEK
jgi:heme/copper-type cytochrome/quinol oxidase subunit 2